MTYSPMARLICLLPTRELAQQVSDVLAKAAKPFHWLVCGTLLGGERKKSEKARLRKGLHCVVATPGRLVDHMRRTKCFDYSRLEWLVLDEADRLLDLGFEADIDFVLSQLKLKRSQAPGANRIAAALGGGGQPARTGHHTLLVSATLSTGVARLAQVSLRDPLRAGYGDGAGAGAGTEPAGAAVPASLAQHYASLDPRNRCSTLCAFLH